MAPATPEAITALCPTITGERAERVADFIAAYTDGLERINACDLDFCNHGQYSRWRGLGVGDDFLTFKSALSKASAQRVGIAA